MPKIKLDEFLETLQSGTVPTDPKEQEKFRIKKMWVEEGVTAEEFRTISDRLNQGDSEYDIYQSIKMARHFQKRGWQKPSKTWIKLNDSKYCTGLPVKRALLFFKYYDKNATPMYAVEQQPDSTWKITTKRCQPYNDDKSYPTWDAAARACDLSIAVCFNGKIMRGDNKPYRPEKDYYT